MAPSHVHSAPPVNGHTSKRHKTTAAKDVSTLVEKLSKYGNPALHVNAEHQIELRETEVPTPAPHEVLIHVRCTGICTLIMRVVCRFS
jgi:L-iditol 2-dehydrogenase